MKRAAAFFAFVPTALAAPRQHDPSLLGRADRGTSITWAGGVAKAENITAVSGTFPAIRPTLPTASETGKGAYTTSAWVGIDGYSGICINIGLWKAGVMTHHQSFTGMIFHEDCYELYPDPAVYLDIGKITDGDVIKVSLEILSSTQAKVDLEILSTGTGSSVTTNITHTICQQTAEWIVQRYYTISQLVGLIGFGTETIDDIAYTTLGDDHTTIPDDVILVDIVNKEANNTVQTHTQAHDSSTEVTFLGN